MTLSSLTTRTARLVAGGFALAYILAQLFQFLVVKNLPETRTLAEALLQGSVPANIWRAGLLLLSFFGLVYTFLILCLHNFEHRPAASVIAFIGLLIFCLLEIGLRSVETFYIQLQLPTTFRGLSDPMARQKVLDIFSAYQSVQWALYFPLLLSQAIASLVLALSFETKAKLNYLITAAFGLNAIRLAGRILEMHLNVRGLSGINGSLYLPAVITIFGLISVWLIAGGSYGRSGPPSLS